MMVPTMEYPGHQLVGGSLKMSPHHKWLGSCGADGRVMMRAVGALVCGPVTMAACLSLDTP